MKTDNNIIKRKAIDTWGKLGTTYDAPRDRLILANDIRGPKVSTLEKCSICKVFSGDRSTDLVNYLEKMNFNDALRQSLLLRMIKPSGVSSLMDYNQPVNENTRFLYYSYRNKTEELKLTPENAAQIMARETVIKLRQNLCESEEINKVISDQHYSSLTTAFDTLHKTVEQWWTKANLISRLKNDQIQYKEISEIVPQAARLKTLEEINAALILNFSRTNSSVILYYSTEQRDPAVVIPVSFITTTGDNFDEITVKFGDVDSNENFQNQGQSVTQHCRSYIIDLNEKVRLRLIDTPGIGDTRGFDQDEINMNNILTYINQLSHINAVCLLLKPTNSKLDVFFRSCVKQLLTYLTPDGYGNIIFCFTNSRSTFYAPGLCSDDLGISAS
ncbi:unnamed protein product [Rotaria sordida]|uniref:G domain-containing protein n=1 Tax=Rotaria sordida TaxID=392033 RepID=A0A815NEI5_9BILA|nr:unnamed protein product [Rotaria sordida]CAF3597224.1 unnamed protein product [Rotaria sordida]